MDESSHGTPHWVEIIVHSDPSAHDALSSFLFDLGCQGILTEDAALKAYYPLTPKAEEIRNQLLNFIGHLEKIFPDISVPSVEIHQIETQDWNLQWRRFFRARQVTEKLLVLPPWEPLPQSPDGHLIRIDPGPAFGTGSHPTTQMCLRAMEMISPGHPWTMLDVGTGSGILAIYAAMLGARNIVAIDTDPEAVRWANRNIALNNLHNPIEISNKPLELWKNPFSLIAANLTQNIILETLPHISRLLGPGGSGVLSGLLKNQVENLEEPLATNGLFKKEAFFEQEWASLIIEKAYAE